ncbi:MAG TPA: aminotransferase class I/II-fold pyridoxal phosphate-dependent enzyme [Terracidiphilus sp.]|nr:aminotransferase class I/II-fold pyridoxal phosphate-dependent enzyme [Terracidiphilus sp.]
MARDVFPDVVPGLLDRAAERLAGQFAHLPVTSSLSPETLASMAGVLDETAERLGDNYPYFHPLYAGQMLKPPHPIARAAYALAMGINPNNHARDGGRASSEMEIEAVAHIARMFGWESPNFLGHLTSSGTIANLEALWVAGQQRPGQRILGSSQAHYTHSRISAVLKLPYDSVRADHRGRIRLDALESELKKGDVGTVVATLGTTAMGAVDPLDRILELQARYNFRVHVDAAYGGYFKLIPEALDEPARGAYAVIHHADSIVVDPHKHGLQPYGCGCILFRDPSVGRFYKHDSPYTYFTSKELHLGEISLECSRAGSAAVALWATHRLLPLIPGGAFAAGLVGGRRAALGLHARLAADSQCVPLSAGSPELDIVVWKIAAPSAEESSRLAQRIFDGCARRNLHLALVQLPQPWFEPASGAGAQVATPLVTCLRSVLMKPEHEEWLDRIWQEYQAASDEEHGK